MNLERAPVPHPALPAALADFLRGQEYAALTQETQWGTTLIVKAPRAELAAFTGMVPVRLRHERYQLPTAPVIRMRTALTDRTGPLPEELVFETFINVADAQQRSDYALLAPQPHLTIIGYDERLARMLGKRVAIRNGPEIGSIRATAETSRAGISDAQYDFDGAKQSVIARTTL